MRSGPRKSTCTKSHPHPNPLPQQKRTNGNAKKKKIENFEDRHTFKRKQPYGISAFGFRAGFRFQVLNLPLKSRYLFFQISGYTGCLIALPLILSLPLCWLLYMVVWWRGCRAHADGVQGMRCGYTCGLSFAVILAFISHSVGFTCRLW